MLYEYLILGAVTMTEEGYCQGKLIFRIRIAADFRHVTSRHVSQSNAHRPCIFGTTKFTSTYAFAFLKQKLLLRILWFPREAAQAPWKLSRSQGSCMQEQTLTFHSVPKLKSHYY